MTTIRYFAWVREKVGREEETVQLPPDVQTVADLIAWLKSRGPEFEAAFENERVIRTAVDQAHAMPDASVAGVGEIAFFPPVTGG